MTVYMNLNLPTPTVTLGPQWATDVNTAFETVDAHDHTTGKGQKITPLAININEDLSMSSNNLNAALSVRFSSQSSVLSGAADISSLYVVGGDLYYNNSNGDNIRITNGTAIDASTVGGIGGDYGTTPAVVNYTSLNKTYTFDTDTNRKGALDSGAITVRETDVVSANGVTLQSPVSLPADYSITFANAQPSSTQLVKMTSAGILDYEPIRVTDEVSLETTGADIYQIKDSGVTTLKIADSNVTTAKIANLNVTTPKIADSAVTSSKIAFTAFNSTLGVNATSVTINVTSSFSFGIFSFRGADITFTNPAGSTSSATWTGPAGILSRCEVITTDNAFIDRQPLTMFNLILSGQVFAAGSYTFTFAFVGGSNVARFNGGGSATATIIEA